LRNPKWGLLAESFFWSYKHVDESAALLDTIKTVLDRPAPSLFVAPIDYRENAILTKHLGEITMGLQDVPLAVYPLVISRVESS
jgi:hypothetical protein